MSLDEGVEIGALKHYNEQKKRRRYNPTNEIHELDAIKMVRFHSVLPRYFVDLTRLGEIAANPSASGQNSAMD